MRCVDCTARLMEVDFTMRPPVDMVAFAMEERSPEDSEDVSAGVGPGPSQEEAVDPASGPSRDPLSVSGQ